MGKVKDLTGQRFGRLKVVKLTEFKDSNGSCKWLCRCDCGTETIVVSDALRGGKTKSCGCYQKELVTQRNRRFNSWEFFMNENIAVGTDSRGKTFTIDAEDWLRVKDYCWYVGNGYVKAQVSGKSVLLHRFLMNPPDDMCVDHINGDPTDERKSNLRIVTKQQNAMNRKKHNNNQSGHTGVNWHKGANKWAASIRYKGNYIHLGSFTNKEDAIKARKDAELKYYGEYRRKE